MQSTFRLICFFLGVTYTFCQKSAADDYDLKSYVDAFSKNFQPYVDAVNKQVIQARTNFPDSRSPLREQFRSSVYKVIESYINHTNFTKSLGVPPHNEDVHSEPRALARLKYLPRFSNTSINWNNSTEVNLRKVGDGFQGDKKNATTAHLPKLLELRQNGKLFSLKPSINRTGPSVGSGVSSGVGSGVGGFWQKLSDFFNGRKASSLQRIKSSIPPEYADTAFNRTKAVPIWRPSRNPNGSQPSSDLPSHQSPSYAMRGAALNGSKGLKVFKNIGNDTATIGRLGRDLRGPESMFANPLGTGGSVGSTFSLPSSGMKHVGPYALYGNNGSTGPAGNSYWSNWGNFIKRGLISIKESIL